jgi:MoaA/NifB/PqqE/SkfB family radical SAM enzyme
MEGDNGLQLLWLELTARCNPHCVHYYANSSPDARTDLALTKSRYLGIFDEASQSGCRLVRFKPTLFRDLISLLDHARATGFELVEPLTNATHLCSINRWQTKVAL